MQSIPTSYAYSAVQSSSIEAQRPQVFFLLLRPSVPGQSVQSLLTARQWLLRVVKRYLARHWLLLRMAIAKTPVLLVFRWPTRPYLASH